MKKFLLVMCSISLISVNSYSEIIPSIISTNDKDVVLLEKGTEAPFKGYLFPEHKVLKIRQELIELDNLKLIEKSYQRSIDLYKDNEEAMTFKVNALLEQNDKLSDALYKQKDRDSFETRLWFVLGMTVTGLAVYGAGQLK